MTDHNLDFDHYFGLDKDNKYSNYPTIHKILMKFDQMQIKIVFGFG